MALTPNVVIGYKSLIEAADFVATQDGNTTEISLTSAYVEVGTLTIPSAGTWDVYAEPFVQLNGASVGIIILRNGVAITPSPAVTYGNLFASGGVVQSVPFRLDNVTLSQGDVLTLQVNETDSGASYRGDLKPLIFQARKVAGFVPASLPVRTSFAFLNRANQNTLLSPDGALEVRAWLASNGGTQARSLVGGSWLVHGLYVTDGVGQANRRRSVSLADWTEVSSGTWGSAADLTQLIFSNQTTGKMYRMTRQTSNGYAADPTTIELMFEPQA